MIWFFPPKYLIFRPKNCSKVFYSLPKWAFFGANIRLFWMVSTYFNSLLRPPLPKFYQPKAEI
jgi:hypothetical protein